MIIVLCNSETSETANKSNLSRKSLDWPCVKRDRLDCASFSMWRFYSPGNGEDGMCRHVIKYFRALIS